MSASIDGDAEGVARRVRVVRLETVRDLEALLGELQGLRGELVACEDGDGERIWDLLHAAGVMTGVWLDDIACRFAGSEQDADELFARAWQFVDDLGLEPGGFLTREDPALFTTLRGSTASMLARLWVTGFLLGPVPQDVWPAEELAVLLLRALEHHADARALTETLDHHHSLGGGDASASEGPGRGEEQDEPREPDTELP